jgi:Xaa-Pro aminopeptidase
MSSDVNYPEFQDSFFYYLFGASEMGCYGLVDLKNSQSTLFVPKVDPENKIWMEVPTLDDYKDKYHMIDKIFYSEQLDEYLEERCPKIIYQNYGINSDS